jgi:hypothetical protein
MSLISTVYGNLKTLIQATLGSGYTELSHCYEMEKNSFETATKRWGLLPYGAPEVEGETRANTCDLRFIILLTDEFGSIEENDASVISKEIEMMGKYEDLWKAITVQKAGSPGTCILTGGYSIQKAVTINKTRIIVVDGQFFVRVRNPF